MGITLVPASSPAIMYSLASPLVFKRDFSYVPSLGADATFTRATNAQVADHNGRLWEVQSGEPRFNGFRRSENIAFSGGVAKTGENISTWYTEKDAGVTVSGEDVTFAAGTNTISYVTTLGRYQWLDGRVFALSCTIYSATLQDLKFVVDSSDGTNTASSSTISIPAGTTRLGVVGAFASGVASTKQLRFMFSTAGLASAERIFKITDILIEELSSDETAPNDYYADGYRYYSRENGNTLSVAGVVTSGKGAVLPSGTGLLKEEAATNYYPQSDQHSLCSTNGSPNNVAFTAAYGLNRMGHKKSTFAYKPAGTTGTAIFWKVTASAPHPALTQYCHWAVVKARGVSKIGVGLAHDAFTSIIREAKFDLATGTYYGSIGTPDGYGILPLGNGYYLIYVTATTDADGGTITGRMQLYTDAWSAMMTGNDALGIELLESQVERGAVPSSHIRTPSTGAVTRNTDALSYSDVQTPNDTEIAVDELVVEITDWDGIVDEYGMIASITARLP